MNYRRGFFRAWVLLSVLWIGAIATLAISATGPNSQNGVIYSYVYVMRPDIKPPYDKAAEGPIDEVFQRPSEVTAPPTFAVLERRYWDDWRRGVAAGRTIAMSFPDGSEFMTSAALNEEDRKFLSEAFWDQRWWRLAERAWPWAATAVAVPPLY